MKITVMASEEQFITVEVDPNESVENVKALLEVETGVAIQKQQLQFNGKEMGDPERLNGIGVGEGDLITMTQKASAGVPNRDLSLNSDGSAVNAIAFQEHIRQDSQSMAHLFQNDPSLAQAFLGNDINTLQNLLRERHQRTLELRRKENEQLALMYSDPFDIESQKKIEESIRQKGIDENWQAAIEHNPESFAGVVMLYVDMEVNGIPIKAFVDSGAQSTIISKRCAESCGLLRLLDQRYKGIAVGVGQSEILGRIHVAPIKIGSTFYPCSFAVLDTSNMDFLFGLDMLRKHQCIIDLKENVLRVGAGEVSVPFLQEKDIPSHNTLDGSLKKPSHGSASVPESSGGGEKRATTTTPGSGNSEENRLEESIFEAKIGKLVTLGFSRQDSIKALSLFNNNEEQAAGDLLACFLATTRMNSCFSSFFFSLSILLLLHKLTTTTSAAKKLQSYVVYLGEHSHSNSKQVSISQQEAATDLHHEFLASVVGNKEKAKDAIFYSYTRHINGFAANLEEDEALAISKLPEVISVFPNKGRKLHTTHVWEFLGLEQTNGHILKHSPWEKSNFGENVIIANLDTGVWPDAESFNDQGMGPVPSRWKGSCQKSLNGEAIHCNRKLIGAKYFNKGYLAGVGKELQLNASFYSPMDYEGHGTHTLSTAGGAFVPNANIAGYGNGTAKGGSPNARVASYKICFIRLINGDQCFDADFLAAIDVAIADGVDILSLSIGGDPNELFSDAEAIGSFHAVKSGITVLCSAGNDGRPGSVSNIAPWIITVAANTFDREFPSYVILGNGKRLKGQSFATKILPKNKFYPIVRSVDGKARNATMDDARFCSQGSLDPTIVKGKIVVCEGFGVYDATILQAGGVGVVYLVPFSTRDPITPGLHLLPATVISKGDAILLNSYIDSTDFPTAQITQPKTKIGSIRAPIMADFSSSGPNQIIPDLLKPDITAPGVLIMASNSPGVDHKEFPFVLKEGTSMACPIVAGVAGLIKNVHPDWSPAAIKSAILTTAMVRDNRREHIVDSFRIPATAFNYGHGHIHPTKVIDPGLIYDISIEDYLDFVCALDYNSDKIKLFSSSPYSCPTSKPKKRVVDLNYPSITISNLSKLSSVTTVTRTVKNVGVSPANYTVGLFPPIGVSVEVDPTVLEFKRVGQELSFKVSFAIVNDSFSGYSFGSMVWSDGIHYVRSPLVVQI